MSSKMTQRAKILQYLYDNEWITPLDALREFGCMRLAARIGELIRDGYAIEKETVYDRNRNGDAVHYARYRLRGLIHEQSERVYRPSQEDAGVGMAY